MKLKHISLVTLTAIIFCCLSSCLKKGEDDPLFSLRTRKARVVGKWKIESGTDETIGDFYFDSTGRPPKKITTIYSENSFAVMFDDSIVGTGSFSYEIEFRKDGEFVATIVYNTLSTSSTTLKGTWNFTDKIGTHKNKEQIILHFTSKLYFYTEPSLVYVNNNYFSGNKSDVTYYIQELRNKKIVLVSEDSTTDYYGKTDANKSKLTFTQ